VYGQDLCLICEQHMQSCTSYRTLTIFRSKNFLMLWMAGTFLVWQDFCGQRTTCHTSPPNKLQTGKLYAPNHTYGITYLAHLYVTAVEAILLDELVSS
jgi:hypothetical protein